MDGTKPNMDSNAEENQDEGQESKGTARQRFLRIFVSVWRRARLRQPERFAWLLSATSYGCSEHILTGFAFWKRSAKINTTANRVFVLHTTEIIPPIPRAGDSVIVRLQTGSEGRRQPRRACGASTRLMPIFLFFVSFGIASITAAVGSSARGPL